MKKGLLDVFVFLASLLACSFSVTQVFATPGQILYVHAAGANVRSAPGTENSVIMKLARGDKLMELERRGAWLRVLSARKIGMEGWIHSSLVDPHQPEESKTHSPVGSLPNNVGTADDPSVVSQARRFQLAVSGSPAMAVRAECIVITEMGERKRVKAETVTPLTYAIGAQALSCLIQKRDAMGRLKVALLHAGQFIASVDTAAPYNYVRVRSDGPWGKARAFRGSVPTPLWQHGLLKQRRPTVPPLSGPIVPPLRGKAVSPLSNSR